MRGKEKSKMIREVTKVKEKRGITLIALVVTIVVLLILSAVTLNLVLGDGGIISKAQLAKDETLNAIKKEQEALNELYDMLSSKDNEIGRSIKIKEKTETAITVEAEEGYTNYQFSIDGKNWTEAQESNAYTFNNLEKTVVNRSNYEDIKGKEYTIYVKGEKDNKEEEFQEIKTKLNVEVEVPETEYYFTYRDLGEEIEITGRRDLIELVTENGTSIPEDEDTIMIPSYINGKPVTKVNAELLRSLHNMDGLKDKNVAIYYNVDVLGDKYTKVEDFIEEGNAYKTRIQISGLEGINKRAQVTVIAAAGGRYGKRKMFMDITDGTVPVDMACDIYIKLFENVVIPPTVKEITNSSIEYSNLTEKTIIKNRIKVSKISNSRHLGNIVMQPEIKYTENEINNLNSTTLKLAYDYGEEEKTKIYIQVNYNVEGNKLTTDNIWGYTPVHVKILGKENKEEIGNILYANEINKQNGEPDGEEYEPDGNIPEYKIDYTCIY